MALVPQALWSWNDEFWMRIWVGIVAFCVLCVLSLATRFYDYLQDLRANDDESDDETKQPFSDDDVPRMGL